jgi:hypothetical protein
VQISGSEIYSSASNRQDWACGIHDDSEGAGCSHFHAQMRSLSDAEHQEIDRSFPNVLKDLIVCAANSQIRTRIAEVLCLFRYKSIKGTEKAILQVK